MFKAYDFSLQEQVETLRATNFASVEVTEANCSEFFSEWLVKCNKLIGYYIKSYGFLCSNSFTREDLEQEAWEYILKAKISYKAENGDFFKYAGSAVRNGIIKSANKFKAGMHLKESEVETISIVKKAAKDYADCFGEEPSADELAELTGLSFESVKYALSAYDGATNVVSLYKETCDEGACIADLIEASGIRQDEVCELRYLIDTVLDRRERMAVKFRYGFMDLDNGQAHTLDEVAKYCGFNSRQAANAVINGAIRKLRQAMDPDAA